MSETRNERILAFAQCSFKAKFVSLISASHSHHTSTRSVHAHTHSDLIVMNDILFGTTIAKTFISYNSKYLEL